MLVLVLLNSFTNKMFVHTKPYPKHVHKTLFLDEHFTDEEVKVITSAADEWTQKTHHIVEFSVEKLPSKKSLEVTRDVIVIPVTPSYPDIILSDNSSKRSLTLGYFNDREMISFVELVTERLTTKNYKTVVLHELGHSLGLEHNDTIDGIDTLMFPTLDLGADHITYEDLKSFCSLYHCDAEKLKN